MERFRPTDTLPRRSRVAESDERRTPAMVRAQAGGPDAVALTRALRRRWALALALGLAAAVLVGPATWFFIPGAKYTAEGTLIIQRNPPVIANPFRADSSDPRAYQQTQLAKLRNRSVLAHALAKPEIAALPLIEELRRKKTDPEDWLAASLKAEFANYSEVLTVTLSGDHPADLAAALNAVVQSYMVLVVEAERQDRKDRLDKLVELKRNYQSDLATRRNTVSKLVTSLGSHDPTSMAVAQQFTTSQIGLAQSERTRAEHDILRLRAELLAAEGAEGRPPKADAAAPAAGGDAAPALADAALEDQVAREPAVAAAAAVDAAAARRYREVERLTKSRSDPALQRALRAWNESRTGLEAARAAARQSVRTGAAVAAAGAARPAGVTALLVRQAPAQSADAARLGAQIKLLEDYAAARAAEVERLQADLKGLSQGSVSLEADREAIAIAAEFSRKVGLEIEAVKAEMSEPERVRVYTPAKTPRSRDKYRKLKAGAAAGAASFALAALGVAFLEYRAHRVCSPDDVTRGLGLRLFGALPAVPAAPASREAVSLAEAPWRGRLVDSVDMTRTTLLHATRGEPVRVIMVTSAVEREGKTSVSSHISASLGRAGRRTLLIDCDLRRPAIHRLLDLPPGPGLSEVLRGEVGVSEVIRPSGLDGLDVITAGRSDPTVLEALARDDLKALLDRVRQRYDFVILDTPPVLPVIDSLLISQFADGVLLSVLRDVSRKPQVSIAHERLAALGARTLGAVVSGVSCDGPGYGPESYGSVGEAGPAGPPGGRTPA
jgi:capsular exopolysaccharide synthesis family protein